MYIGIDIGGTTIKAGLVDKKCNIIIKDSIPTRARESYELFVDDIVEFSKKITADAGYTMADIESIGVGCPGSVDDKNGIITYANNLNLEFAPLGKDISEKIGLPVYLGNDANCAALGEFFALGDETLQNFVAITLGTGVGGGIVINRRIYTGFNGAAGELGHIILKAGGEPCTCGRDGCWEAYASATALIRETERAAEAHPTSLLSEMILENGGKANGKIPFDAAKQGDKVAENVVNNYIQAVSEGIVDVINIFQPEALVIGGGISKQGDSFLNAVRDYVKGFTYGHQCNIPIGKISLAKLGNDAGIVGAALLGIK